MNETYKIPLLHKHLQDLLKDIKDHSGVTIDGSIFFEELDSAFFDTKSTLAIGYSTIQAGYFALGQSLYRYVLETYRTLRTTFLERVMLQAQAALPFAKLASCFKLDDQIYDAPYEGSDRLAIILGALQSHYDTTVIDSFLHPQFKQHIFVGKSFQQLNESNNVIQFENLVQSRGGSCDFDYEPIEGGWPLQLYGWNCSVIYQLGRHTPYILHQRKGKSKKQAKLRALHDIYNYYSRHGGVLILHCDPSTVGHPHFEPQSNTNTSDLITISIPTDQLYEYGNDDYDKLVLNSFEAKRIDDPNFIDMPCDLDSDDALGFLARALLCEEDIKEIQRTGLQLSPATPTPTTETTTPSPPAAVSPKQQYKKIAIAHKKTILPLPPKQQPSPTRNEVIAPVPSPTTDINNTTQLKKEGMDQNNQPQNTITKEQTLLSSPTLLTTVSPTPTKVPLPTIPQDKELEAKATQLMDLLTYRDRERLDIYGDHLKLNPNDSKGYLKNLVTKIDGGLYSSSTEFIQIEKTRSIYVATVEFGTKDIKMTLTQVGSRKTEAECKAAMAIYKLLQTAAKVINNQMDLLYY